MIKLIEELYVIPDKKHFIVYAPLKRKILQVNKEFVKLLDKIRNQKAALFGADERMCIESLKNLDFINASEDYPENTFGTTEYSPTSVTFLPTSNCNLQCIYCYSNSNLESENLSIDVAFKAIDLIIENALKQQLTQIQIGFLGGGEPFLEWDFVTTIIRYAQLEAKKNDLSTYFTGVTNGVLSEKKIDFIIKNFNYLNISIDGTKEIQNIQRPKKNRKESFESVVRTIYRLNEVGFKFGTRSTISSMSVNNMIDIVKFLNNDLHVKKIHFEPLHPCGRAKMKLNLAPDPLLFIANFKKCLSITSKSKSELFCSAIRLDTLTSRFCGALNQNFYVVPNGYVTACTEVSSIDDHLSEIFFIGRFDTENGKFVFDEKKIRALSERKVTNIPCCSECIAKWHCAGACPVKGVLAGNLYDPSATINCLISKELTEFYIKSIANGKKGLSPRITEIYN